MSDTMGTFRIDLELENRCRPGRRPPRVILTKIVSR